MGPVTRACGMDISVACYNLGYSYAAGLGMEKDPKRAAELYRKACDLGFEAACEAAARLTPQ